MYTNLILLHLLPCFIWNFLIQILMIAMNSMWWQSVSSLYTFRLSWPHFFFFNIRSMFTCKNKTPAFISHTLICIIAWTILSFSSCFLDVTCFSSCYSFEMRPLFDQFLIFHFELLKLLFLISNQFCFAPCTHIHIHIHNRGLGTIISTHTHKMHIDFMIFAQNDITVTQLT